jgi:hypothetical protein
MGHLGSAEQSNEPVDQNPDEENQIKAERQERELHHAGHFDLRFSVLLVDGPHRARGVLEEFEDHL